MGAMDTDSLYVDSPDADRPDADSPGDPRWRPHGTVTEAESAVEVGLVLLNPCI